MRLLDTAHDAHVIAVVRGRERFGASDTRLGIHTLGKHLLAVVRRINCLEERKALAGPEVLEMHAIGGGGVGTRFTPNDLYWRANLLAARDRDLRESACANGEFRGRSKPHATSANV